MNSIFVLVDTFSKMSHFIPCCKTSDATFIANLYFQEGIQLRGILKMITLNQDAKFMSYFWHTLWRKEETNLRLKVPIIHKLMDRLKQLIKAWVTSCNVW